MSDGRVTDVYIEEVSDEDDQLMHLLVFADAGHGDTILSVEGARTAYHSAADDTAYVVFVDPRYDLEWIKKELEAAIKIQAPNKPRFEKGQAVLFKKSHHKHNEHLKKREGEQGVVRAWDEYTGYEVEFDFVWSGRNVRFWIDEKWIEEVEDDI